MRPQKICIALETTRHVIYHPKLLACLYACFVFQSSDYPELSSAISGEIQLSENYFETKIKTKAAGTTFIFEQLFSSQASLYYQELLFKLILGLPEKNLAYGVDFEHRYSPNDNTNKLELKWGDHFDFNGYLTNKRDAISQKIRAGLKYSIVDLKAGADLMTQDNEVKGNTFLEWGSLADQSIKADFDLVLGSGTDYKVRTALALPHFEKIHADGQLRYTQNTAHLELDCRQGSSKFTTEVRYSSQGSRMKINGEVTTSAKAYKVSILTRNDNVKSVQMELDLDKIYSLNAAARHEFHDLMFDFSWDKESNPEQRLILKVKVLPKEVEASYRYVDSEGRFRGVYDNHKIRIEMAFDAETAFLEGEYTYDPDRNMYGVKSTIETSMPALTKASLELEHVFERHGVSTKLSQKVF